MTDNFLNLNEYCVDNKLELNTVVNSLKFNNVTFGKVGKTYFIDKIIFQAFFVNTFEKSIQKRLELRKKAKERSELKKKQLELVSTFFESKREITDNPNFEQDSMNKAIETAKKFTQKTKELNKEPLDFLNELLNSYNNSNKKGGMF